MATKLLIVESPAKAKTIAKYLGSDFQVAASMGHVRDLPKNGLGVDLEHDFAPEYEVTKQNVIRDLRKAASGVSEIFVATDPDREGEAIAWHVVESLGVAKRKPVRRVVFSEITRSAVQNAVAHPRTIDSNLVNAQQARRVLDRLVGYQISPLLWDKVRRGLSAGRVQSVAVRLIVEREKEIEGFTAIEYWTIEADLLPPRARVASGDKRNPFRATLVEVNGKKLDKFDIGNQDSASSIVTALEGAAYQVTHVARRDKRRNPAPPFTTSTLQQEAARKLGYSAKRTMALAQQLYEGIDIGGTDGFVGLITYMRTDSTSVAREAQTEAREVIEQRFGQNYLPAEPPTYRTRAKNAQEAHEAIRPTSAARSPERLARILSPEQMRLYDLIWRRFLASQMAAAIMDSVTVDIGATPPGSKAGSVPYLFRATGSVVKFPGFLAVYREDFDEGDANADESERRLPIMEARDALDLQQLLPIQHFTEPPPRFTEASLVKELESLGIGRPSTYAQIMSTIQEREYVELREKKLLPTMLGRLVTELLTEHFGGIVDYEFTSNLEQQLDDIAAGEKEWIPVLRDFYSGFSLRLSEAKEQMRNVKRQEIPTDLTCPKCGKGTLMIKFGRNGEFLACSRYSKDSAGESCDFTSNFHRDAAGQIVMGEALNDAAMTDIPCNLCGKPMVIKKSRFGPFLGCSDYPTCKNTRRLDKNGKPMPLPEPTGVTCPMCKEGELLQRRGKFGRPFYGCNRYPNCTYIANDLEKARAGILEEQKTSPAAEARAKARAAAAAKTAAKAAKTGTTKRANSTAKKATTGKRTTSTTRSTAISTPAPKRAPSRSAGTTSQAGSTTTTTRRTTTRSTTGKP